MGTNCLGPFTFNDLLLPLLKYTAASKPKDSVRVVWLSSVIAHGVVRGGFIFDDRTGTPAVLKDPLKNSREALQAWRAITVMLQKLNSSTATTTHHISSKDKQNADVEMQFTSPRMFLQTFDLRL